MATAREVVKAALRKILSLGDTDEPSSSEMADGLEAFNDFMESLVVDGVFVSHQTLTLDDEVNIDKSHIRTLKNQLAIDLAPEFGAAADPQIAFQAQQGMKAMRADTKFKRPARLDNAILRTHRW